MANKTKMKCAHCHKAFKSSKATQTLCDECERKRRQERAAQGPSLVTTPATAKPHATQTPSAAPARPAWMEAAKEFDPTTLPPPPPTPPMPRERPVAPVAPVSRGPHAAPVAPRGVVPGPRKPAGERAPRPFTPRTPKPLKEKKEPPKPYQATPEEIAAIQARYLELAQPEFDGIRTQISREMQIPKHVVKKAVAEVRTREHLPSWWDVQGYQGPPEDLERINAAYAPQLPVPPIGVHRIIAKDLEMTPMQVYRGIRTIRMSLGLPVFNPPELHPESPKLKKMLEPHNASTDASPAESAVAPSAELNVPESL